jgi:hypothetical protein
MADLQASDVMVTLTQQGREFLGMGGKVCMPTIAFGNGALTYPVGGIPMPALGHFGMYKGLARVLVLPNGDGKDYVFNRSTHKLMIYSRTGGGLQTYNPGGGDIFGGVNTDSMLGDEAALPLNANLIDTLHAVQAGPVWAYSEDNEPDVARNVCILLKAAAAGSVIPAGTYTFTVTGTFRGAAQVETISFVFAGVEGTIAADQHRYLYGVKPFERITSVVITPAHLANLPADLLIGVGVGTKLGLPSETLTNAEADILKLVNTGVDVAVAGKFDGTNKTVSMGSLANADNISIQYVGKVEAAEITGGLPPDPTVLEMIVIGE